MKYSILKRCMKDKNVTQAQAAKAAGISERSFRNKISGRTAFTVDEAIGIWYALFRDLKIQELFYRDEW